MKNDYRNERTSTVISTSSPPSETATPPHSYVTTLIQKFTPQLQNDPMSAMKPLDLGILEDSIEPSQADNSGNIDKVKLRARKDKKKVIFPIFN